MSAGIIGSIVINHMRLLTPREVDKLTETLADHQKLKPLKLLTDEDSADVDSSTDEGAKQTANQAKIIPLHKITEDEEDPDQQDSYKSEASEQEPESDTEFSEEDHELSGPGPHALDQSPPSTSPRANHVPTISGNNALKSYSIFGPSQEEIEALRRQEEERKRRPSTSMFILAQKEKTKRSADALRGKDAVASYKKNSYVDIVTPDEDEDEDFTKSTTKGILLNKKQY